MPFFVATIENKPGTEAARARAQEAHREYLRAQAHRILIGGAVLDDAETAPHGSVYVFEAETARDAQRFTDEDPLTVAGTRSAITIRPWRQAVFNRDYVLGTPEAGAPFPVPVRD
ncbi:YciI family protein [Sphingobium scionense]|uniref:YCII-related domain-containing protein n=2 Tax=Sphingomonadaceae TaxID=41297 RepID=A0A1L4A047_9SPHN|nr:MULTISPECIES: YciI family protein [Sphingomonadaceae]API61261.1 hypothetical protein BSL82_17565 [Tardibacter chloracetimidivorans]MBB4151230.1 uncharacterized protein YciI [Sphingobium scionense]